MNDEMWFRNLIAERENDPDFLTEELVLDVTEQISKRMRERGVHSSELARRLGVSRAFVSQLLNGKPNMTMRTLVGVAYALDQRVRVALEARASAQREPAAYTQRVRELHLDHDDIPYQQAHAAAA